MVNLDNGSTDPNSKYRSISNSRYRSLYPLNPLILPDNNISVGEHSNSIPNNSINTSISEQSNLITYDQPNNDTVTNIAGTRVKLNSKLVNELNRTEVYDDIIDITDINNMFKTYSDKQLVPILLQQRIDPNIIIRSNALYFLGRIYCDPKSEFYNLVKGVSYINIASKNYNHNGATCIRAMWEIKLSRRKQVFKLAARNNSRFANMWLARYYYTHHKKRKALKMLTDIANTNYVDALNELGKIYYNKKKYNLSFEMYLRSHNLNNIIGTKHVGLALKKGDGTPKDMVLAKEFLTAYWMQTKDHTPLDDLN
jgi:hypothetical protein